MARGSPQRGDFTGRQQQKLQQEHADELQRRQTEIGLTNQADIVVDQEGVFDPQSGDLLELPDDAKAKVEALSAPVEVEEADPVYELGEGPSKPNMMQPFEDMEQKHVPKPSRSNPLEITDLGDQPPVVVEPEYIVIRVNSDIEDMTYGYGNTYTFLRGKRYRVPQPLATHLEEKGLVHH